MKILEFDYVDAKGKHSHRRVVPIERPVKNYMTIDITELSVDDEYALMEDLDTFEKVYTEKRNEILDNYGVLKFRSFIPDNMSNVDEVPM